MTVDDTIAVRQDERLDEGQLQEFLRGRIPGSDRALTVRQFGGGAANLTYQISFGSDQYVLRRPPLGPLAPSSHDMLREYSVLSVLHKKFPLAPKTYFYCDDLNIIGAPFFVMERRYGIVVRKKFPKVFTKISHAPKLMSEALIDALVDLHSVDFEKIGLSGLGKPDGFLQRQVDGWHKRWHAAKHEEVQDMDDLYLWLTDNLPSNSDASLVHNDYKLDNLMVANDNPGEIVAVFDWDMCTLGDPLNDLGALLSYWSEPTDPPFFKQASMMPTNEKFLTREQLVERYAEKSGRDVSNIRFYHVLGFFRLVGIAAQIYIRFVQGHTQDERFSAFGEMVPLVARYAMGLTQAP